MWLFLFSDALNDRIPEAEPSHAIEISALPQARQTGDFTAWSSGQRRGEMAEAVAPATARQKPDPALEKTADD